MHADVHVWAMLIYTCHACGGIVRLMNVNWDSDEMITLHYNIWGNGLNFIYSMFSTR